MQNIITDGQNSPNCSKEGLINPSVDNYFNLNSIYTYCSKEVQMLFQKGNKLCVGRKCSEETRKKISLKNKGRKLTEESRRKMSESRKGELNGHFGKHHTHEVKRKISELKKGRKLSEETKRKIALSGVGRVHSEETKHKIALANSGIKFSEERKQKISLANKGKLLGILNPMYGKKHSDDVRSLISDKVKLNHPCKGLFGENNPHWLGGLKASKSRSEFIRRNRGFVLLTTKNQYNEPIDYHHIHPYLPYVIPVPRRIHIMFLGNNESHYANVNTMVGIKFEVPTLLKHTDLEGDVL